MASFDESVMALYLRRMETLHTNGIGSLAEQVLQLFDVLPDVHLFVKDRQSRFTRANTAWLRMHGCRSEAEAIGKSDFDFHPPALASQYVAEDARVMESRKPLIDQAWLVGDHRGTPQWFLCTKLPLFESDGSVAGIAGVLRPFDQAGNAPAEYKRLTPVIEHVTQHYGRRIAVGDLARLAGLSASQLQREFRRLFGISVSDYVARIRLVTACRRLRESDAAIGRVARDCGFHDQAHFTKAFKNYAGQTPRQYRDQWRGNKGTCNT
jgi:AraC-like DNA-binding protein